MRRFVAWYRAFWSGFGVCLGIALPLALVLGFGFSVVRWGYLWREPPVVEGIRDLASIERLSFVQDVPGSEVTIEPLAALVDAPLGHMLSALTWRPAVRLKERFDVGPKCRAATSDPVTKEEIERAWHEVRDGGLLLRHLGTAGLDGAVGVGTTRNGERVLFAALLGPELSNDHHPYYECALSLDDLDAEPDIVSYYVDIAGMGYVTAEVAALYAFGLLLPVALLFALAHAFSTIAARRDQAAPRAIS